MVRAFAPISLTAAETAVENSSFWSLCRLLRAYLHRQSADFHPGMVHLLSPFVHLYSHGELSGVSGGAAEANAYAIDSQRRSEYLQTLERPGATRASGLPR